MVSTRGIQCGLLPVYLMVRELSDVCLCYRKFYKLLAIQPPRLHREHREKKNYSGHLEVFSMANMYIYHHKMEPWTNALVVHTSEQKNYTVNRVEQSLNLSAILFLQK